MVPGARALTPAILGALALLPGSSADDGQEGAGPGARPHERIALPSREACGGCHEEVLREWSASLHARAWTNANARAATRNFERVECRACHSPLPVLPTGLDEPPDHRDFNQEDGVHCLACHGLADGVAAARTIEGAPCRPRLEPRLLEAELCFPCHEPTHQAFQEYYRSQAFAAGKRCADCHMEPRSAGGGRSHGPHGGFDADFVRRAIDWDAALEERELVLTLTNRTGHGFPGEIPSRSFLVHLEFPGAEPRDLLLRKPHKGEEREDDRLQPDETRVLRFPLPDGASSVRLELRFLPLPLLPREQGFLLGEWSGTAEPR